MERLQLLAVALVAQVAVILLVSPMELKQFGIVRRNGPGCRIGQTFHNTAAQKATSFFECFIFAEWGYYAGHISKCPVDSVYPLAVS